jgi:hypothetical protein
MMSKILLSKIFDFYRRYYSEVIPEWESAYCKYVEKNLTLKPKTIIEFVYLRLPMVITLKIFSFTPQIISRFPGDLRKLIRPEIMALDRLTWLLVHGRPENKINQLHQMVVEGTLYLLHMERALSDLLSSEKFGQAIFDMELHPERLSNPLPGWIENSLRVRRLKDWLDELAGPGEALSIIHEAIAKKIETIKRDRADIWKIISPSIPKNLHFIFKPIVIQQNRGGRAHIIAAALNGDFRALINEVAADLKNEIKKYTARPKTISLEGEYPHPGGNGRLFLNLALDQIKARDPKLWPTIEAYVESDLNFSETARKLKKDEKTIRKLIKKIEK